MQESQHTEFKRQRKDDLLKWISAFANALYRQESYPMAALREGILNAVVHRDYAGAIAIQISMYPDKLMIWNPGQLPEKWTLDLLMNKHASSPFNASIANVFFRAGLIESWGRGIERITEACPQNNYPIPQWKLEPGGLWVTFQYSEEYVQQVWGQGRAAGSASGDVSVGVKEVLGFVRANQPVNTSTIATHYPQVTQRTIERWLKTLCEQGEIEFKGAPKTGGYFTAED